MTFLAKLEKTVKRNNSLLCVGLDTDPKKIPKHLLDHPHPVFSFNKSIIDATHDIVACYKPNLAYYESHGTDGMRALRLTVDYIQETYDIPVIADAKRADIASTSEQYAKALFKKYHFDAVTVNPYLGLDSIEPFLSYKNRGVVVLCRTSNQSASDFQDLQIAGKNMKMYAYVAKTVVKWNTLYGNCLLVMGATHPRQIEEVRTIAKDLWFLVPGVGFQGGDMEKTLQYGLRGDRAGLLINVSRSLLYASAKKDFAETARNEAERLKNEINKHR